MTVVGTATPAVELEATLLAQVSGVVAALLILAFQAAFLPFALPFLEATGTARGFIYPLYAAAVAGSLWAWLAQPDLRSRTGPLLVAGALLLAPLLLHPPGPVSRSYLVTLVLGLALVLLALSSSLRTAARLGAAVTALGAALCLLDILVEGSGFTNTAGRAAGLAINPNDAGTALVLGAVATCRSLPARWQASFVIFVGGGILATQSRSMILIAVLTGLAMLIVSRRERRTLPPAVGGRTGKVPAAATALVVVALLASAYAVNGSFRVATGTSVAPPAPIVTVGEPPWAAGREAGREAALAALDRRLVTEGHRSSLSARWLFLQRGLLVYAGTPFFGIGLEEAHRLAPHNGFLMFGLAFGHFGWLVPLAVLAVILLSGGWRGVPLAVAVLAVSLTSHSLLVMPGLFVPVALGIAVFLGGGAPPGAARIRSAMAATVIAGAVAFAAACLATALLPARVAEIELMPQYIQGGPKGYRITLRPPALPGVLRIGGAADGYALVGGGARFAWVDEAPVAPGQFTVRDDKVLLFLPADGSDPVWNGVDYRLAVPLSVGQPFIPLVVLVLAWGAIVAFALGRKPAA